MSIPGFTAESSVYKGAAAYGSARVWAGGSGSVVHPAQDSSCFSSCFESCAVQCFANPFWTWGPCVNSCNSKCTLQPCPPPTVCQNGSCVLPSPCPLASDPRCSPLFSGGSTYACQYCGQSGPLALVKYCSCSVTGQVTCGDQCLPPPM